jgi:D-erythro-7,8-dihydroneopterin triphosphate epimerase
VVLTYSDRVARENLGSWVYRFCMDRIHIKDLEISGIVGINPEERTNKQGILINLTLWVDTHQAAVSDDIDDTVNYRTLCKSIIGHVESGRPELVERLADEVAAICLEDSRVEQVEVTVEKPGALRFARSVGITVLRSRLASPPEVAS